MSKLSQAFDAVVAFFEGNKAVSAVVAPISADLSAALQAAEAALPAVATAGANAALALLGTEGAAFAPLVDDYIDGLIADLTTRKSAAAG